MHYDSGTVLNAENIRGNGQMTDTQINILKAAMDWTKAEMLSSAFFAVFGLVFLAASYFFWQLGKTDTAKAYVIPFMVVGGLLIIIGVGLMISNQMRLSSFPLAFNADAKAFLASEIARAEKTVNGYNTVIFRVLPLIVITCAVLLMLMKSPVWQASMVAVITMMAVILIVDTNASARIADYKEKLVQAEESL